MPRFTTKYIALAASLSAAVHALGGITVPTSIAAGNSFPISFEDGNSDSYRVYLAAALVGVNGPTCYLENSTSLSSPFDISIPASVGPSADYYSIAIADLTTSQGAVYSNRFNLTGGTGQYSQYESQLGGAPFWDANDLPCTAYACARACASASYPSDLTDTSAYDTMKSCILNCSGVTPAPSQTAPALASSASAEAELASTVSADEALITLAAGVVVTAIETTAVSGGKTVTEAIVDGSRTIVLGGAATVLSSVTVSLASDGVAVGGTTTLPFTSAAVTMTNSAATTTGASAAAASSSGAAVQQNVAIAGVAGMAGLAVMAFH